MVRMGIDVSVFQTRLGWVRYQVGKNQQVRTAVVEVPRHWPVPPVALTGAACQEAGTAHLPHQLYSAVLISRKGRDLR